MKTHTRQIQVVTCLLALLISSAAMAQESSDLIAIHEKFGTALNAHDFDLMVSYFTEDCVFNLVPDPAPMHGREEIKAFFEDFLVSFPDIHTTEGRVLATGNIVVVEHSLEGTHDGDWQGVPPTGNTVVAPHLDIYEFEGDKIKRFTTYMDMLGPLMQVGAVPMPDPFALVPTHALPEPEATGQSPWDADVQVNLRWNTHDLPQYAKLYHSNAALFVGPLGATVGRNEWVALTELLFQGFSGQSHVLRRIDFGDGLILAEFQNRAVHNGPYMGIPASGTSTNLRSVSLIQYDADGLAVAGSYYYDELTLMTQISPPEPAAPLE